MTLLDQPRLQQQLRFRGQKTAERYHPKAAAAEWIRTVQHVLDKDR